MAKSVKLPVATFFAGLAIGLLLSGSRTRMHFGQSNTNALAQTPTPAKPARIMTTQSVNKSNTPRSIQLISGRGTLNFQVPPRTVLLTEAETNRMMGIAAQNLSGRARVSIEQNGKQRSILEADEITVRYASAWIPFREKSWP